MHTPNTQGLLRQANPAWLLPTRMARIRAGSSRPLANILSVGRRMFWFNFRLRVAVTDFLVVLVLVLLLLAMVAVIVGFSIVAVGIFSRWFRCMSFGARVTLSPVVVAPLAVRGVAALKAVPAPSSESFEGHVAHGRPMSRLI